MPSEEVCDIAEEDEDCDGESNEDGMGCVCVRGETAVCYTGPPSTLGVGVCHAGLAICAMNGLGYDACTDEQAPSGEDCDAMGLDEDCDGQTNEDGPNCVCGDGWFSSGETCED